MTRKPVAWINLLLLFTLGCGTGERAYLSNLDAGPGAPLYTTYSAAKERSQFLLDEGYHLRYDNSNLPLALTTDNAGDWFVQISEGETTPYTISDYANPPTITLSYPDMAQFNWQPIHELLVKATFIVHSSRLAILEVEVQNLSLKERNVALSSGLSGDKTSFIALKTRPESIEFRHRETPDNWTVRHNQPHVGEVFDLFTGTGDLPLKPFMVEELKSPNDLLGSGNVPATASSATAVGLTAELRLLPKAVRTFRFVRGVAPLADEMTSLERQAEILASARLDGYRRENELLFANLPKLNSDDDDTQLLYHSAWSMMRQMLMPPEAACQTNYYLFSREPSWGWGHGGQVFHESLTMLAYGRFDPVGAMDSQRIYANRQHADGYINYRTGPYLNEVIETNGQLTTSAPFYAWQNWEIYKRTRDRVFLEQMYASSRRFHDWFVANRDADNDDLCEWGGHAVLESVRDASAVVWDEVAWPAEFDALDLNCMLVMEEKSLAAMAGRLGLSEQARHWRMLADERGELIRQRMWDEESGFFYHNDRGDDDFSHSKPNDLKRLEIIGFLPLWAGIATEGQASRLVQEHLLNPSEFWRPYGIPTLAANDPSYNPKGYWNGPVWVQWSDLIVRGLLDYGYRKEAAELTERVAKGMIEVARQDHTLWEFYSPDEPWGGWHQAYFWAGMINDMLLLTHGQR